jgi:hypothetical protein
VRAGTHEGLACMIVHVAGRGDGCVVRAPGWRVLLPGRTVVFHAPGTAAELPVAAGAVVASPADQLSHAPEETDREPVLVRDHGGRA